MNTDFSTAKNSLLVESRVQKTSERRAERRTRRRGQSLSLLSELSTPGTNTGRCPHCHEEVLLMRNRWTLLSEEKYHRRVGAKRNPLISRCKLIFAVNEQGKKIKIYAVCRRCYMSDTAFAGAREARPNDVLVTCCECKKAKPRSRTIPRRGLPRICRACYQRAYREACKERGKRNLGILERKVHKEPDDGVIDGTDLSYAEDSAIVDPSVVVPSTPKDKFDLDFEQLSGGL